MMKQYFLGLLVLVCLTMNGWAGDGEGTARVAPKRLIAGTSATITVDFQVGPGGIPVGGGVILALHHAATWNGWQFSDPKGAGYVTVTCETPGNFSPLTAYDWFPATMVLPVAPTRSSDTIFNQGIAAKVTRKPLRPGEHVRFVLGANEKGVAVQYHADKNHEFRIMTDGDGNGTYKGIPSSPKADIVAGPAKLLEAVAPSILVAGQPFEMQVRAEDAFHNLADDYAGQVQVADEQGKTVAKGIQLGKGVRCFTVTAKTSGPVRFRVSGGGLAGRSNPCRVFKSAKAAPPYRIFWGDIHGHTDVSDGLGDSPRDYFTFGRDVAHLDVCALTDHGHFEWPATIAAVKEFNQPGRYVTILAQEGGTGPDHVNLYYRDDTTNHIASWPSSLAEFRQIVAGQYDIKNREVITGPHHFTYHRGEADYPFVLFKDEHARFVEVYSTHGASEYLGNPRPLHGACDADKFMQAGLARGLKFGVIASGDSHDGHPGHSIWPTYPSGLVAFLAPDLTRGAIWDAFWNRKVYATSFDRIYIEFSIDGQMMGSDVAAKGACRVKYYVIGQTDKVRVDLIRNNKAIRTSSSDKGVVEVSFKDTLPAGESFYYLRVTQADGEQAWSTPIWVKRK